jgi:hypothetical protein
MFRKVVWLIALLVVAALGRFALEQVAGSMLRTADVLVASGDYDGARERLDRIDGWFSWTDAGKGVAGVRAELSAKIAEEQRRAEAEREQRELERAQAASAASSGSEGGSGSGGVYLGLNRAEPLRQKKR